MRVLFVLHQFFPEFHGGTERVTLNLARMAQRAGHLVHILACTVEPEKCAAWETDRPIPGAYSAMYQGLAVTWLPRSALPATGDIGPDVDEELANQLAEWMRAERFDVAHVMHTMRMGSAVLALQRAAIPYVLTLTDFFLPCARINQIDSNGQLCAGPDGGRQCAKNCLVPPWTSTAYANRFAQTQAIFKAAGARVAPSHYVAERFRQTYPDQDAGVQVIPHGIDFMAMAASMGSSERLPEPGTGLELVFIGSIVPQKGLDVLLKALAMQPELSVKLTVIGGFYGNPAYQQHIHKLVEADPRVTLMGTQKPEQVFKTLAQADLLCLPSVVPESYSLVFHESAVAGVPALVSDLGAPPQHVQAHQCGRVVAAGDPAAWAQAIEELVNGPEILQAWKKRLFLPLRLEEEAFFYNVLYQRLRLQG